jgi:hypothetical protein
MRVEPRGYQIDPADSRAPRNQLAEKLLFEHNFARLKLTIPKTIHVRLGVRHGALSSEESVPRSGDC